MNIGIDISQIAYKGSGVARFTEGLVQAILDYDKTNTWYFFYFGLRNKIDEDLEKKIINKGFHIITRPIPPTILDYLHNTIHTSLFSFDSKIINKLDYFITSDWTEPPLNCKKATIVHDFVFKRYPQTVHETILKTQELRLNLVSQESDIIFTDSQSTISDLNEYYDYKGEAVLNYPGVNQQPIRIDPTLTLEKYDIQQPFLLTVGKIEPRKNIAKLMEAFERVDTDMQLIIAGAAGWGDNPVPTTDKVKLIGYVSDQDLEALYQAALCFIYPSIYEGFGYPVIEAMIHECPVLTSNASSLSEIAQNAAILFDPHDIGSIAHSLKRLINDEPLRNDIKAKGLRRAGEFTWQRYYTNLVETLGSSLHATTKS